MGLSPALRNQIIFDSQSIEEMNAPLGTKLFGGGGDRFVCGKNCHGLILHAFKQSSFHEKYKQSKVQYSN